MELAFYSNKCALKDAMRMIKRSHGMEDSRRKHLVSYSTGLIGTNESIIELHSGILPEEREEFRRLVEQFKHLEPASERKSEHKSQPFTQPVVNPTQPPQPQTQPQEETQMQPQQSTAQTEETCRIDSERGNSSERARNIEQVAEKMQRLSATASFVESVVALQGENLDRPAYSTLDAVENTNRHVQELEEILLRKKRALLVRRWIGGCFVFLCFLSLLLLRPSIFL